MAKWRVGGEKCVVGADGWEETGRESEEIQEMRWEGKIEGLIRGE